MITLDEIEQFKKQLKFQKHLYMYATSVENNLKGEELKMKKKLPTKAQKWQRKRFRAKGTFASARSQMKVLMTSRILTAPEMIIAAALCKVISWALEDWGKQDKGSKQRYLLDAELGKPRLNISD